MVLMFIALAAFVSSGYALPDPKKHKGGHGGGGHHGGGGYGHGHGHGHGGYDEHW